MRQLFRPENEHELIDYGIDLEKRGQIDPKRYEIDLQDNLSRRKGHQKKNLLLLLLFKYFLHNYRTNFFAETWNNVKRIAFLLHMNPAAFSGGPWEPPQGEQTWLRVGHRRRDVGQTGARMAAKKKICSNPRMLNGFNFGQLYEDASCEIKKF